MANLKKKAAPQKKVVADAATKPEAAEKTSSAPTPTEPVVAAVVEPAPEVKVEKPKAIVPAPPPAPVEDDEVEGEDFSMLGGAKSAQVILHTGAQNTVMGQTFRRNVPVMVTGLKLMKELYLDGSFHVQLNK